MNAQAPKEFDRGLQALVRTALRVHAWHTPAVRLVSIAGAAYWTGFVAGARDYANGIGTRLADAADGRGDTPSPDELDRILQCCRAGLSVNVDGLAMPKVVKRLAAQGVQLSDELIAKLDIDAFEQLENGAVTRSSDFDDEHTAAVVDSNDRPFHEPPPASTSEVYRTSSEARAPAVDGGSIFPTTLTAGDRQISRGGLSRRDYFAAHALQGIIACFKDHTGAETVEARCRLAYKYADAMLAARAGGASHG